MSLHAAVTGFKVRSVWVAPRFWWHTLRGLQAARHAPGIVSVSARMRSGLNCTLTVWVDRAAMRAYVGSPVHRAAMALTAELGEGLTCNFPVDAPPDWDTAFAYLDAHGRPPGARA